ncbi:MAG: HAMP domain-containing protein [Proteobacteria bacterium]|nr:HAMP domain-containing protein [Pseudomonadota bacterium]
MAGPPRFGIGGRLGLAFGLSAVLAILACVIGWLSYDRVGDAVRDVARVNLPSASTAAQIAQVSGSIIALMPLLSQTGTEADLEQLSAQISQRFSNLRGATARVPQAQLEPLQQVLAGLADNLGRIGTRQRSAIALAAENEAMLRNVRSLHSDFVEEAEPLIDDARFMTRSLLSRSSSGSPPDLVAELRRHTANAEAILQLSAHANLAVGLLSRIAVVSGREQLTVDDHFLAETGDLLRQQLATLENAAEFVTIRQIVSRLLELSNSASGLPHVRRLELETRSAIEVLLAETRGLLARLEAIVSAIVTTAAARAGQSTATIAATINIGRNLLLAIAGAAVLASGLIAFAYVRGNLINRIRRLADAARQLASGHVPTPIEVTGRDELTDMAQAMESFRRTQEELVQSAKLAALGQMSVGLAHELNQPLNAIRAQAHNALLMQQRGNGAGVEKALEKVQALTQRASLVVAHLNRFARRSDRKIGPVSVDAAIDDALFIADARLKEAGATIRRAKSAGVMVMGDDILLSQVLVNLLSNAADAVAGRTRREIGIAVERDEDRVVIIITDTGPGIPPEVAATLFDPFTTTKPPGQGLGLGLTISYNIIRDFGGLLSARSHEGGATFQIALKAATEGRHDA